MSDDGIKKDQYQESFLAEVDENSDIPPVELSGDESAERTVLMSDVQSSKSNFLLTVTTIMKTVIGAGILSIPFTISRLGYVLALVVFALIVMGNQFTCKLLLKSKNLSRHSNYSSISYHIFRSKIFQGLCSSAILINNLGICIAELTIFKEAIRQILVEFVKSQSFLDSFFASTTFFVILIAIVELPFTLVKKIQKLKYMAFLGVAGILVFVVCLVINFFNQMSEVNWQLPHTLKPFPTDALAAISVLPNLMLALSYQMNFFPIYKGLKNSCDSKMSKASIAGIGGCALFYLIVGNIGYALYGYKVEANFLLVLEAKHISDVLYFGMNIGFLVSVFFSFPVMFFGARNNFISIVKLITLRAKKREVRSEFNDHVQQISSYIEADNRAERKRKANQLFYIFTLILYAVAIGVAIVVSDIESVFNIIGSVAANSIGFIFPCLFYWQLVKRKNKERNVKFYMAMGGVCFFIPFGILSVVSQFIKKDPQDQIAHLFF